MNFHTHMRFLVVVTVIATLVKAFKLNCITGKSKSNETSSETDNDLHFNETWTWLPYTVNISESKNVANPWDKILPVRGDTLPIYNEETNWCVHIGDPFEKVNFSKFQLSNECCKGHVQSVLVEIKEKLLYKCTDETEFYNCLKKVNTSMSRYIGDYYFQKAPSVSCYKVEEQQYCFRDLCSKGVMKISIDTLPEF